MITKDQMYKMKRWYYPYISDHEVMRMSGWKLYIYGETVDDSYIVCQLLTPIMEKYNLTMKAATQHIINMNNNKNLAWSIAVVYLNAELFQNSNVSALIEDIKSSLKEYSKTGTVRGAKSIDGKISYRYELKKSIDPSSGVVYDEYIHLYRGGNDDYNIPQNPDIEHLLKQ